jgi:hypothetical protein
MTDIPQLGPEVFVDDADNLSKQARSTVSPLLSPMDIGDPRSSFITHGLDGAARMRRGTGSSTGGPLSPFSPGSPGRSPQLSPHRATNSAFSFEAGEQLSGGGGSGHGERVSDEVSQRDGQTKEKEHCDKRRFSGVWKYVCIFGIWSGVRGIYLELDLGRPCVSHDGLGGASEAF